MISSRFLLGSLTTALVACGGAQTKPTTPGGDDAGSGAKPAAAGDVSFGLGPIEINGVEFEPLALGRPGMPLVNAKKATTLDKERQTFAAQKDVLQKQAHAGILATMLFQKSKEDKANEKALWTEARQALADAAAAAKDKPDELTLRLLGTYNLMLEDYAGAEKAWSALTTLAAKDKEAPAFRAWWAYSLLVQHKNAEALEVVKNETPSDKQAELAYTIAWAKWRNGDNAGAWTALTAASKGWDPGSPRDDLDRDLLLFASRNRDWTADATAKALLDATNAKQPAAQYNTLAKLGAQAFQYAGRWAEAVSTIDKALAVPGAKIPPNEVPFLRFQQTNFSVVLDKPEDAAKYGKLAVDAMPACGAACPDAQKQELIYAVFLTGRLFHNFFATANDLQFYQPAKDLYTATVSAIMDPTKRAQSQREFGSLDIALKNRKAGTGTHDAGVLTPLLRRHDQEVQACYETGLIRNPKLAGNLTVELESDQTGVIKGVATDPKAGAADMSAVAGCVAERVNTWKLPTRGTAGSTRIKLAYTLAPAPKATK